MAVPLQATQRRIAVVRAGFALAWAAALLVAVGGKMPSTHSDLATGTALLLATYPLIDAVATLIGSNLGDARILRINAAISAAAAVALAVTAFGSDAGSAMATFGAWAAVSGLIQLGVAIHRRRSQGRQVPAIISGGLSTFAGIMFVAASGKDTAHLANVAGYMALGAVLFLIWAYRDARGAAQVA